MSVINPPNRIEVVTSVQRRRRWTASEKVRMVEETFAPGMTVSLVARQHGVAPNQLFTWRRLVAQGSLTAAGSGEEVVPASDYRALQNQVRELHRLLGKKTLVAEIIIARCDPENKWFGIGGLRDLFRFKASLWRDRASHASKRKCLGDCVAATPRFQQELSLLCGTYTDDGNDRLFHFLLPL